MFMAVLLRFSIFFSNKGIIMSYKNTCKIFGSNFVLVWKQLVYLLISTSVCVGLSYLIAMPTIKLLTQEGWIDSVKNIFETVYTSPSSLNAAFKEVILSLMQILSSNFGAYFFSIIGFIISAVLLPLFLNNIAEYNICYLATNKISSNIKLGYTSSLLSNLKDAIFYALLKMIIDLLFIVCSVCLFCVYLILSDGTLLTILMLILYSAISIMLSSVKMALTASFAPIMLEEHTGAWKAFLKSGKMSGRSFARTLSCSIVVMLTVMFANIFLGVFTIGVALLITVPASVVFIGIFKTTNYFTIEGKSYYLSDNIIAQPKKSI